METLTKKRKTNSQLQREFKLRQRRKGLKPVSFWIEEEQYKRFQNLASDTQKPKSELLTESLRIGFRFLLMENEKTN